MARRSGKSATGGLLTVAAWNVEWLFDGINDPLPVPPRNAAFSVASKIQAIAAVLREMNADIVHMAEVENCAILDSVAANWNSSYKPLMISGTDSYLRQQVALLTHVWPKSALTRSTERVELIAEGQRSGSTGLSKHLIADFSIAGRELRILGLHLKARPHQPDARVKREGQARIAQNIIHEALRMGEDVIVLGDFNDFDSDVPDPSGEVPSSKVLRLLKDVDNDGRPDLWNVLRRVPVSERYSSWYDRNHDGRFQYDERQLIDHILVSNSLTDAIQDAGIFHRHDPTLVSDHWPVWVKINLEALSKNQSLETGAPRHLGFGFPVPQDHLSTGIIIASTLLMLRGVSKLWVCLCAQKGCLISA